MSGWMGRSLAAMVVAAGWLELSAGSAEAFARANCDGLFGGANIAKVDTFKINAGAVDFGDNPHLAGGPQGTAVVCWSIDGRIAVLGKVYADSIRDNVMAIVLIRFRRDGVWSADVKQSVFGNFAKSAPVNFFTDAGHFVDRVRVRLFNGNVTALGDGSDTLLATKNFRR